jgi:hypothetical protein
MVFVNLVEALRWLIHRNAKNLPFLDKPVGNGSVYPRVTVYTSANYPTRAGINEAGP